MASADFSRFVVTTANGTAHETSRDKPASLSSSTCLIYAHRITVAFWTSLLLASLSAMYALYQVSVRQATISLSLLLAHTSQCKPWELLWGSSATTPLLDFHHRLTACPSYQKTGHIRPVFQIIIDIALLYGLHVSIQFDEYLPRSR